MIHYHGTPISGSMKTGIEVLSRRHAMVSFADTSALEMVAEVCQSFCFDNGAFTAWKRGGEIDIEEYASLIYRWHKHPGFDFYIIPDVIDGDHHANNRMRGRWKNLVDYKLFFIGVPVWHMHEPLEVLRDLCHAYQRVAIGSSGEYATVGNGRWWGRMTEAMRVACDDSGYPKTKLHGLRMLDPTIYSHLPLSSADSTNVARNVGIDKRWRGTYTPKSKSLRGQILMERIESHAGANKFNFKTSGVHQNHDLFG